MQWKTAPAASLCVEVCPAKNKTAVGRKAINMEPQLPLREEGAKNWEFFRQLPEQTHTDTLKWTNVKNVQLLQPLFEFSGACAGCGETPYLKLISQLYGDRSVIANATGCSSIYGGNLPTTPWSQNPLGAARPGRIRSLRTTPSLGWGCASRWTSRLNMPRNWWNGCARIIGNELADALLSADQSDENGIDAQRERVVAVEGKAGRPR